MPYKVYIWLCNEGAFSRCKLLADAHQTTQSGTLSELGQAAVTLGITNVQMGGLLWIVNVSVVVYSMQL